MAEENMIVMRDPRPADYRRLCSRDYGMLKLDDVLLVKTNEKEQKILERILKVIKN